MNIYRSKTCDAYERHAKSMMDFLQTCGLNNGPTVKRTIWSLPNIKGINPLNNQVAKGLCVKTIKEHIFSVNIKRNTKYRRMHKIS